MIYDLQPEEGNYECIELIGIDSFDLAKMINSDLRLAADWTPFKVRRVHPTSNKRKAKEADIPLYGSGSEIFMRPRAVEALRSLLEDFGEILPVDDEAGAELYVFHCLNFVDALDKELSEIEYFDDAVKILRVAHYQFRPEVIAEQDIFRLVQRRPGSIFVSQRFVDAVEAAKLIGLTFRAMWPLSEPHKGW